MPHIDVRRTHALGRDAARALASEIAADLQRQQGVRTFWDGDVLRLKGPGVQGELHASDTEVRIQATLGMLMRPMRGALQRAIEEHLDDALG
ncbi:MAG: polyhydroxyalkanoic acid system family protein [Bacteroidota bacterium]